MDGIVDAQGVTNFQACVCPPVEQPVIDAHVLRNFVSREPLAGQFLDQIDLMKVRAQDIGVSS